MNTPEEIPTPRTDSAIIMEMDDYLGVEFETISPHFARQLERENIALREALLKVSCAHAHIETCDMPPWLESVEELLSTP